MAFDLPPLPSFTVQQPDVLGNAAKVAQLRNMMSEMSLRQALAPLQIQQQQQQVQAAQMENEMKQMQVNDARIMSDYFKTGNVGSDTTGTPADFSMRDKISAYTGIDKNDPVMGLLAGMANKGLSGPGLLAQAQSLLQRRTEYNKGTEELQTIQKNERQVWQEALADLHEMPADQRSVGLAAKLPLLQENSKSDPLLAQYAQGLAGHPELIDFAYNTLTAQNAALGLRKAKAEATEAELKAQKTKEELPGGGLVSPEQQELQAYLKKHPGRGADDFLAWKAQTEANAKQVVAQGDPNNAGKLLENGSVTLADLKSRGTTPQFIMQTIQAAQKIRPTYNPADEVIAEQTAKSPANLTFFGSANSLLEKGGTLDQLIELGKKIPQHDWPVLNTVDDWQKLARGKGPLSGYAAKALGVADDYSKVMGGGQGSDTSRDQALKLFSGAASPEQRKDAVDATRGAVLSQRDSRIGTNQFLKRAYGSGELGGQGTAKADAAKVHANMEDFSHVYTGAKGTIYSDDGRTWYDANGKLVK